MKKLLLALSLIKLSMKKLLLITFMLCAFKFTAQAQNTIALHNSGESTITFNANQKTAPIYPEDTIEFYNTGSFSFAQDGYRYHITCPQTASTKTPLDTTTIAWLAGSSKILCPKGLDHIEIKNDTLYPILVRYILSKIRSQARLVGSEESSSKVVHDQEGTEPVGSVEITDENHKTYTINFPRRMRSKVTTSSDWATIKLCANTIALFKKDFCVRRK